MKLKETLETIKARIVEGGRIANSKIAAQFRRSHLLPGDAWLMKESACDLESAYRAKGYSTQSFNFTENGTVGILIQIGNFSSEWMQETAATLGGQRVAVNIRLFPQGSDLELAIDCGKWVDKALSGVLAWTVFAPLVVFPVVGLWRQKRLIDSIERDIMEWLDSHRHDGCIDVSM